MKVKHKWIIGIDEVGRGPLAGPVTVCACVIPSNFKSKEVFKNGIIKDSKKLKKDSRYIIYQTIRRLRKLNVVEYSIYSKSAEYIDKHGISKAIKICIENCIKSLENKNYNETNSDLVLDGGLSIKNKHKNQKTIIKGDEKELSIALASIIAKHTRDTYMEKLSKEINNYNWDHNMGYGTAKHLEGIKKFGITKYHRITYIKHK